MVGFQQRHPFGGDSILTSYCLVPSDTMNSRRSVRPVYALNICCGLPLDGPRFIYFEHTSCRLYMRIKGKDILDARDVN